MLHYISFFFFNDTATTEIYTLSLHDALPIFRQSACQRSLEMPYSDEADERSASRRSEMLEKLLVPVAVVGHVLFYDVLPALLTWVVGSTAGLDLFSAIDNPSLRRLAGLGLFPSALAAIITTQSVTRLARPLSLVPML